MGYLEYECEIEELELIEAKIKVTTPTIEKELKVGDNRIPIIDVKIIVINGALR